MSRLTGYPVVFGDAETAAAWERDAERARANQKTRYAVAPLACVVTADGRRLRAGDAVHLTDFAKDPTLGSPERQLERHISTGRVLESDRTDVGPEAA
jgi:hypothetical protein